MISAQVMYALLLLSSLMMFILPLWQKTWQRTYLAWISMLSMVWLFGRFLPQLLGLTPLPEHYSPFYQAWAALLGWAVLVGSLYTTQRHCRRLNTKSG